MSLCWLFHKLQTKCSLIKLIMGVIMSFWPTWDFLIWNEPVSAWQKQQNDLCAERRHRSVWAWASAQSDQSSLSARGKIGSLGTHKVHSEDWSDWVHRSFCWFFSAQIMYRISMHVTYHNVLLINYYIWWCDVNNKKKEYWRWLRKLSLSLNKSFSFSFLRVQGFKPRLGCIMSWNSRHWY